MEEHGYNGGEKIKGRKRHIVVDVHSADTSDRVGVKTMIEKVLSVCPTIKLFWADRGYLGKNLLDWVQLTFQKVLGIVKHPKGKFKIVQWRRIVERTFG